MGRYWGCRLYRRVELFRWIISTEVDTSYSPYLTINTISCLPHNRYGFSGLCTSRASQKLRPPRSLLTVHQYGPSTYGLTLICSFRRESCMERGDWFGLAASAIAVNPFTKVIPRRVNARRSRRRPIAISHVILHPTNHD